MTGPDDSFIAVLDLGEAPVDHPRSVEVEGKDIIIFRYKDRYVAMDRWCPHRQGDLACGSLIGKAMKCPLHGFMFSVETGRGLNCAGFSVKVHDTLVENNILSVRLS